MSFVWLPCQWFPPKQTTMSKGTAVSISTSNTTFSSDTSSVSKNGTTAAGDTVTVNAYQDGTSGSSAVVVLQVNSNGRSTASVDKTTGIVTVNATGSGITMYLSVTLNSSDTGNWTVYVNTSGGSTYTFTKGRGGGGH